MANQAPAKTVTIRIRRQDGPAQPPRWETFFVPARPNMNLISALQFIAANPATADGVVTTPPVWESVCLEEMCGACTMLINGQPRQACSALVDRLGPPGAPITLEPLTKFPLVRDLIVDRQRLFNDLKRIKAWVPISRTDQAGPGPLMNPALQQQQYALARCFSCAACLEACPQYTTSNSFVGAAIISQALLFNQHPVGAKFKSHRLDILMQSGGIGGCDSSGKCDPSCPKGIPNCACIDTIGKQVIEHAIKRMKPGTRRRGGASRGRRRGVARQN